LVDPSGELKETVYNMIPALKYEDIHSSSVNGLFISWLYRTLTSFVTDAHFFALFVFSSNCSLSSLINYSFI
jgi:hypothetical protein